MVGALRRTDCRCKARKGGRCRLQSYAIARANELGVRPDERRRKAPLLLVIATTRLLATTRQA